MMSLFFGNCNFGKYKANVDKQTEGKNIIYTDEESDVI